MFGPTKKIILSQNKRQPYRRSSRSFPPPFLSFVPFVHLYCCFNGCKTNGSLSAVPFVHLLTLKRRRRTVNRRRSFPPPFLSKDYQGSWNRKVSRFWLPNFCNNQGGICYHSDHQYFPAGHEKPGLTIMRKPWKFQKFWTDQTSPTTLLALVRLGFVAILSPSNGFQFMPWMKGRSPKDLRPLKKVEHHSLLFFHTLTVTQFYNFMQGSTLRMAVIVFLLCY